MNAQERVSELFARSISRIFVFGNELYKFECLTANSPFYDTKKVRKPMISIKISYLRRSQIGTTKRQENLVRADL